VWLDLLGLEFRNFLEKDPKRKQALESLEILKLIFIKKTR
jgi:hypothetical protein